MPVDRHRSDGLFEVAAAAIVPGSRRASVRFSSVEFSKLDPTPLAHFHQLRLFSRTFKAVLSCLERKRIDDGINLREELAFAMIVDCVGLD